MKLIWNDLLHANFRYGRMYGDRAEHLAANCTMPSCCARMLSLIHIYEGVSTLVVQTEKGSTTLNLSLLVEGQKGTDRVVLRRLGENTFLTVGLRCRRDLIVGR